ncbi:MAG: P-II family nitrogen regulator [Elusimicrobia bacterium]|nr:P-II family nitrogen regulator [Elusimicrobiota bacterium]
MQTFDLITCIVQRGEADKVVKKALQEGAQGATVYYGRGTGVRQKIGLFGALIQPEKEVILIVTPADITDQIFNACIIAGKLDLPGRGFAFIQKIDKAVGFLERLK